MTVALPSGPRLPRVATVVLQHATWTIGAKHPRKDGAAASAPAMLKEELSRVGAEPGVAPVNPVARKAALDPSL